MVVFRSRSVQSDSLRKIVNNESIFVTPSADYFDKESFRLHPDYNIWVFDNLLSSVFLELADQEFTNAEKIAEPAEYNPHLTKNRACIPLIGWSAEVFEVLLRIANVRPIEIPTFFVLEDVTGQANQARQNEHMDHGYVGNIKTELSWDRFQFDPPRENVIPTFSFIVYFNDVGGLVFPNVGKTVNASRGRIVMFQNYHSHINKEVDYRAQHYGTYSIEPKRLALFGILTETIPAPNLPKPLAVIYSPVHHGHSSAPPTAKRAPVPKVKPGTRLRRRGTRVWKLDKITIHQKTTCCWVLYEITASWGETIVWKNREFHSEFRYRLEPCESNFFNSHFQNFPGIVEGFDSVSLQYHLEIDYEIAVDEILEFIGLTIPQTRTGWICRITEAQRVARRAEWKCVGCTCIPGLGKDH